MAEVNVDLLRELRIQHGFSLAQISQYLGYKSPSGYGAIEQNQTRIRADQLKQLSLLYNEPVERFYIGGTGSFEGNIELLSDRKLVAVYEFLRENASAFLRSDKYLNLLAAELRRRNLFREVSCR